MMPLSWMSIFSLVFFSFYSLMITFSLLTPSIKDFKKISFFYFKKISW